MCCNVCACMYVSAYMWCVLLHSIYGCVYVCAWMCMYFHICDVCMFYKLKIKKTTINKHKTNKLNDNNKRHIQQTTNKQQPTINQQFFEKKSYIVIMVGELPSWWCRVMVRILFCQIPMLILKYITLHECMHMHVVDAN